MSVQFGRWNFDGRSADREYLAKAAGMLAPYGPDGEGAYIKDNVGILFRALHTTMESRNEVQPHIAPSAAVLTWDGRLDNRDELVRELNAVLNTRSTDVSIVAAAYERWGTACFAKFLGDWAVSIWNPTNRSLILAKDPIGTHHLYYSLDQYQVSWSSILAPLVLLAGKSFALEEEYIAGWLSFFPATHLTPYIGIHSVPPSSFLSLGSGERTVRKYWDFDPGRKIRYRTDAEYEEHFRAVFTGSVRRRLRSDSPVLAELSGGMDSSSIVCVADMILAREGAETPRLDTISYYDDSEPNWNERPYFAKVEEKRGREGCHIRVASDDLFRFDCQIHDFSAMPGEDKRATEAASTFAAYRRSCRTRVVLSGIGGDEVMGGVPTPLPELADLFAGARLPELAHQLKNWALAKRRPWMHLLVEAARGFFPPALVGVPRYRRPVSWLHPRFVKRHRVALQGYERRLKLLGPAPTFQENVAAIDALRRQLACEGPSEGPPYEKRYPYLDRQLLEFSYAIPREQLVRPGQRRSLMRRALVGIVPDEVLNRRRKAFVARAPMAAIAAEYVGLARMGGHMASGVLGIVSPACFSETLQKARSGREVPIVPLLRTLQVEFWLENVWNRGVLDAGGRKPADARPALAANIFSAEKAKNERR